MDRQSVVCHTCTGVLPATDSRTYTIQRGRLIVSNGYCTCPPSAQQPAAQTAQTAQQAAPSVESGTHRQPQQGEQQPANQGVMAGA
ncbi:hypothetical protein SAMN05216276_104368 [Streptosporangium subroseum]|uniref:Uncharacterized protein n=1 Tax=Streptosporangium subroseum TaxID=106412 RepID=A0A239MQR9_9ACTN|nr:hypothetical protein [Streptosporangium subroseum]SNT44298.1 hypothetical protein SAMN05216276_104368 [Streptosporangium subroseum]